MLERKSTTGVNTALRCEVYSSRCGAVSLYIVQSATMKGKEIPRSLLISTYPLRPPDWGVGTGYYII
jgi:hypothetical protein